MCLSALHDEPFLTIPAGIVALGLAAGAGFIYASEMGGLIREGGSDLNKKILH